MLCCYFVIAVNMNPLKVFMIIYQVVLQDPENSEVTFPSSSRGVIAHRDCSH